MWQYEKYYSTLRYLFLFIFLLSAVRLASQLRKIAVLPAQIPAAVITTFDIVANDASICTTLASKHSGFCCYSLVQVVLNYFNDIVAYNYN